MRKEVGSALASSMWDARCSPLDEVRTLSPDRQLLFLVGQQSVIATKLCYYADREFTGRFDQV